MPTSPNSLTSTATPAKPIATSRSVPPIAWETVRKVGLFGMGLAGSATLLGLGAAFADASTRTAVWGISVGGVLVAFMLSWGRLGADVGAALTLGLGVAAAAVYAAGRGSWRSRAAIWYSASSPRTSGSTTPDSR